ncbi:MAG: trehalase-like domain-containing protein [Chloroflexia bacterium]
MSEVAIGDYGFLADGHTGALIGREGSIDWYCPSRFDTPSVFARLLDPEGGHWSIRPVQATVVEREYLDGTMVLRTVFHETRGQAAMTDALALAPGVRGHDIGSQSPQTLLRRVEGLDGEVEFVMELDPRPGYATDPPEIMALTDGALIRGGPIELHLTASVPLQIVGSRIGAQFMVHAGEAVEFALAYRDSSLSDDHEQASPGVRRGCAGGCCRGVAALVGDAPHV